MKSSAWSFFRSALFALLAGPVVAVPVITSQPQPLGAVAGQAGSISVGATGASRFQWYKSGVAVAGATGSTLAFPGIGSAETGIYDVIATGSGDTISAPVVVGVVPAVGQRTSGAVATREEWQNIVHPNGNVYDQFLLTGAAGTFTANPGQIARMSFLDPNGSIVQVEMSGAGAITVNLTNATGPMAPALYNQSGIQYMKGSATIILSGADATTHFTIYSVGTFTNPGVTLPNVDYVGWASVTAAGVVSPSGGLGGIHQGNTSYSASTGLTGIYAPTVTSVGGLVVVHGIAASGSAQPYLFFGANGTANIKIAGTSLSQPNTDSITIRGLLQVTMGAGQDSCGRAAPAKAMQTTFINEVGAVVHAGLELIPSGTFSMGDSIGDGDSVALPLHSVTLPAFYMAKTLTTWVEWQAVGKWGLAHGYTDFPGAGKADTHPVQMVSWYEAVKWCNAKSEMEGLVPCYYANDEQTTVYRTGSLNLTNAQVKWNASGYRLPTEAEWEYAARGGLNGKRFPWGDTISHTQANYQSSTARVYDVSVTRGYHPTYNDGIAPYTSPVGAFTPNGFGLYDMAGNAFQWCWDWKDSYSSGSQVSPHGPDSGTNRVYRGGGFGDVASGCRTAYRAYNGPSYVRNYIGFRTVRGSTP